MTTLPTDHDARGAALDLHQSVLVRAPAGSGKTGLLVMRALACLAVASAPETVVAITFTNKAAAEMRQRVVAALHAARGPAPETEHDAGLWSLARRVLDRSDAEGWHLESNPARLSFTTIDALCGQIASQSPLHSGMGGSVRIEDNPTLLYQRAVLSLYDELDADENPALEALLRFADNRIARLMPFLTGLLGRRDQWLGVMLQNPVDGARQAFEALVSRQRADAIARLNKGFLSDIESAMRMAPAHDALTDACALDWADLDHWATADWEAVASMVLTKTDSWRKKVTVRDGFPAKHDATIAMNALLADREAASCEADRAALVVLRGLPSVYPEASADFLGALAQVLVRLGAHLQVVFTDAGAVDFQEIALRALAALGGEGEASDVLLRADRRIEHLLVDEAQDTSALQYRLLGRLIDGWVPGDGHTMFIVGDPQQSIYAFRQAEVALFEQMWIDGAMGTLPLRCLSLEANFRSAPAIVDWVNKTFAPLFGDTPDAVTGGVRFGPSAPFRPVDSSARVLLHLVPPSAEAARVCALVQEALAENPDARIAVLARSRPHVAAILPSLKAAGVPVAATEIDRLLDRPEIRDVVALIRTLWHPLDRLNAAVLMRAPFVGLSWMDLHGLMSSHKNTGLLTLLRDEALWGDVSEEGRARVARVRVVIDEVLASESLRGHIGRQTLSVWLGLAGDQLVSPSDEALVRALCRELDVAIAGGTGVEEFLTRLENRRAPVTGRGVEVMTMHRAKGLEYDVVILAGLGRAQRAPDSPLMHWRRVDDRFLVVPKPGRELDPDGDEKALYDYASGLARQAAANETRRLLYVAATRARRVLHLVAGVGSVTAGPVSGSLLSHLWPLVATTAEVVDGVTEPQVDAGEDRADVLPHLAPRVPIDATASPRVPVFVPVQSERLLPSEAVLHGNGDEPSKGGDAVGRAVGIVYHSLMERVVTDGVGTWPSERVDALSGAVAARLRMEGVPETRLMSAETRVLDFLRTTLNSHHILPYLTLRDRGGEIDAEFSVSGFRDGRWVSARLDILWAFEGRVGFLDWKGSEVPDEGMGIDAFVRQVVARYREQTDAYHAVLGDLHPGVRREGAIYLPAVDRLVEV